MKMHIKITCGSFCLRISGISHKCNQLSGMNLVSDGKSLCIIRQMCIVEICSMRTPDSDTVTPKFQPAHLLYGSITDTDYRVIPPLIDICHNITAFMSSVSAISAALHPGISKSHFFLFVPDGIRNRKIDNVRPDTF